VTYSTVGNSSGCAITLMVVAVLYLLARSF